MQNEQSDKIKSLENGLNDALRKLGEREKQIIQLEQEREADLQQND